MHDMHDIVQNLNTLSGSAATASLYLGVLVTLCAAMLMRRSLGALPVWVTTMGAALLVAVIQGWQGLDGRVITVSALHATVIPTLLFVLARKQLLPGLRRGEMNAAERTRWIFRNGLLLRSSARAVRRQSCSPAVQPVAVRSCARSFMT